MPSVSSELTCDTAPAVTSSFGSSGVLNTFESTPASRSWNVGVHVSGPVTNRPCRGDVCASADDGTAAAVTTMKTTSARRRAWSSMLPGSDVGLDAVQRAVGLVYEPCVRAARRARRVDEKLSQLAAVEALPLIDAAVAVGVLLGAHERALVVEFVAVGHAVAARGDVHAHLVAALDDPRVFDAVRFAGGAKPIELAVGAVVLPAIDDAVAVAVRFDADGPAVLEIRTHVDAAVAIGVVIEPPDRAGRIINRRHAVTCARAERDGEAKSQRCHLPSAAAYHLHPTAHCRLPTAH